MSLFDVFKLLGGVAFFLFGMSVMSTGLEKMSGGSLERTLRKATASKFKGMALGAGITIAIQSSSAMTVMLVGLVNSGIMDLHQTVGVIMGSNIGTTLTAWVLALAGIESDSFLLNLLNPENFSPLFAVAGIALIMFSKKQKRHDVGEILVGFAVLMFGMVVMKDSVAGLEGNARFASILVAFRNPLLGVLAGAVFTGIVQSSAASVGLLQSFAATVGISYGVAIPISMGANIGTCVTALLSSIGVNKNARRVAVVHIYFNIIGTVLYLIVIYSLNAVFHFKFLDDNINSLGIAVFHSIFNVSVTFVLLPFSKLLEKLAILTVHDKASEEQSESFLDERLLNTPTFAIAQCHDLAVKMGDIVKTSVQSAIGLIFEYREDVVKTLREAEEEIDNYEDKLGTYLIKLSSRELSDHDSWQVSELLHVIGDLERMGDHALNILKSAEEISDKKIEFSPGALQDLYMAKDALSEIVSMMMQALKSRDVSLAGKVEPLEQVIDLLVNNMRTRHIKRLQTGECSIVQGFVWSDMLIYFERLSDHCSNIAVCIIQTDNHSFERHTYLAETRASENEEYVAAFDAYKEKYALK